MLQHTFLTLFVCYNKQFWVFLFVRTNIFTHSKACNRYLRWLQREQIDFCVSGHSGVGSHCVVGFVVVHLLQENLVIFIILLRKVSQLSQKVARV